MTVWAFISKRPLRRGLAPPECRIGFMGHRRQMRRKKNGARPRGTSPDVKCSCGANDGSAIFVSDFCGGFCATRPGPSCSGGICSGAVCPRGGVCVRTWPHPMQGVVRRNTSRIRDSRNGSCVGRSSWRRIPGSQAWSCPLPLGPSRACRAVGGAECTQSPFRTFRSGT